MSPPTTTLARGRWISDPAWGDRVRAVSGRRGAAGVRAHGVVEVAQGEVWWAELPEPAGSGPGVRRPVVVVQGNPLNRSRIATVVCVPLTSNLTWADAPGNTLLSAKATSLPKGLRCQRFTDRLHRSVLPYTERGTTRAQTARPDPARGRRRTRPMNGAGRPVRPAGPPRIGRILERRGSGCRRGREPGSPYSWSGVVHDLRGEPGSRPSTRPFTGSWPGGRFSGLL